MKLSQKELTELFGVLQHGDHAHKSWLSDALQAWNKDLPAPEYIPSASVPIPMILHCPECGNRHVDKGLFATKSHHTHACQECGLVWRPALVPTVGVRFLPGFKDAET